MPSGELQSFPWSCDTGFSGNQRSLKHLMGTEEPFVPFPPAEISATKICGGLKQPCRNDNLSPLHR